MNAVTATGVGGVIPKIGTEAVTVIVSAVEEGVPEIGMAVETETDIDAEGNILQIGMKKETEIGDEGEILRIGVKSEAESVAIGGTVVTIEIGPEVWKEI